MTASMGPTNAQISPLSVDSQQLEVTVVHMQCRIIYHYAVNHSLLVEFHDTGCEIMQSLTTQGPHCHPQLHSHHV